MGEARGRERAGGDTAYDASAGSRAPKLLVRAAIRARHCSGRLLQHTLCRLNRIRSKDDVDQIYG
jgi:hypothetical protein